MALKCKKSAPFLYTIFSTAFTSIFSPFLAIVAIIFAIARGDIRTSFCPIAVCSTAFYYFYFLHSPNSSTLFFWHLLKMRCMKYRTFPSNLSFAPKAATYVSSTVLSFCNSSLPNSENVLLQLLAKLSLKLSVPILTCGSFSPYKSLLQLNVRLNKFTFDR